MGPLARKLEERFTYGDYLTWDDDERWELIDGVLFNMTPTPRVVHQRILMEIGVQFANFLHGKPHAVFFVPIDVRLPENDEPDDLVLTVVQPDLTVICDKGKLDEAGCRGAPDLIAEIFSPWTIQKDLKVKFERYERAGVREYWIVDPVGKTIQVFTLGADGRYGRPQVYVEGDKVRVGIFPDLEIDLGAAFAE